MASFVRTILFTDIEGSTRLWDEHEEAMAEALVHHDEVLAAAVLGHGGEVVKHTGDGILAVFTDPREAVGAAVDAQRGLRSARSHGPTLRVRMGLHVGSCQSRGDDYFGPSLNHAARIMGVAHGGQIVVSGAVADGLPADVGVDDLGEHRLRDVAEPQRLLQVVVDDRGAYPPLRSTGRRDEGLPEQTTSLVGREDAVAAIREAVRRCRLVTLVGVGGVGKTRLAVEVAARERTTFERIVFVDLTVVRDAERVVEAAGLALGLPPGDAGQVDRVVGLVADRPFLLVLDNCEQVLAGASALAARLLRDAAGVVVLATSREALHVDGEHVWPVPPLDDTGAAVGLFCERAASARPGFVTTPADEEVVAGICRQLDGLPLAIELAAARVGHLTIRDIARRLDERFQLLQDRRNPASGRSSTLLATLDWSHELLSRDQQIVLRRSAVFVGGFTLRALEEVAADGTVPAIDVPELLSGLVDASLVALAEGVDEQRYRLLESVRYFGLGRLEAAAELDEMRRRHLVWVDGWLREVSAGLPIRRGLAAQGPSPASAERDNVLAVVEWLRRAGDLTELGTFVVDAAERLGHGVWVDEAWTYLGRADVAAALPEEVRARYLVASAANANALGDFARQIELAEHAREVGRESASWRTATVMLANALAVYDPQRAMALYDELLPTIPERATAELGWALSRSADARLITGDLEEGARRLSEARRVSGEPDFDHGFPHLVLGRLTEVFEVALSQRARSAQPMLRYRGHLLSALLGAVEGRFGEADADLLLAAEVIDRFPIRLTDQDILMGIAVLAHHRGDDDHAGRLLAVLLTTPTWTRSAGTFAVCAHYQRIVERALGQARWRQLRSAVEDPDIPRVLRAELAAIRERIGLVSPRR